MRGKAKQAMKVPETFDLAGTTWRVVDSEGLAEYGHCDLESATIRLRKGLPRQIRESTFCHELIHAIKFSAGETGHDEREVDALGNLLHQFMVTAK